MGDFRNLYLRLAQITFVGFVVRFVVSCLHRVQWHLGNNREFR